MFAASTQGRGACSDAPVDEWTTAACALDLRAFGGVASAVKSMIEGMRSTDPFYTLESQLAGSVMRYIRRRYSWLTPAELVDMSGEYFDFKPETWDSTDLQARLMNDRTQLMSLNWSEVSIREMIASDLGTGDPLVTLMHDRRHPTYNDVSPHHIYILLISSWLINLLILLVG